MKPAVYFDFEDIGNDQVSIDKKRLKEILDEIYQAGYDDGKNSQTIPKPIWTLPIRHCLPLDRRSQERQHQPL